MCAVHTLWDRFFAHLPDGHEPWQHITASEARCRLRMLLNTLGVVDAGKYGTHDFRRGHAEVIAASHAWLSCCDLTVPRT